jgi:hypothetical protein
MQCGKAPDNQSPQLKNTILIPSCSTWFKNCGESKHKTHYKKMLKLEHMLHNVTIYLHFGGNIINMPTLQISYTVDKFHSCVATLEGYKIYF